MFAALDTIDKLAAYSEEEAHTAYQCFLEVNLSGFSIEFKDLHTLHNKKAAYPCTNREGRRMSGISI